MRRDISCPFDITGWQDQPWDTAEGATLGRATVTKAFHGDMEGTTSVAEILTAVAEGSAAYVGIERVVGRLGDRKGTFVLQHVGIASGGDQSARVTVVPGSATGELTGMRGSGEILIDPDGAHTLTLAYELD